MKVYNTLLRYLQPNPTFLLKTEKKRERGITYNGSSKELNNGKTKIIQKNSVVEHKTLKYKM